jgi:prevent-host-death family protein
MKIVSLTNAKARLSSYVKASKREPIVLTCKGKPLAVIYGLDEDDLERLKMASSPELQKILADANRRIDSFGGIPHDQFWEEMARKHPKELGKKKGA